MSTSPILSEQRTRRLRPDGLYVGLAEAYPMLSAMFGRPTLAVDTDTDDQDPATNVSADDED
jgi:hypothetical protein